MALTRWNRVSPLSQFSELLDELGGQSASRGPIRRSSGLQQWLIPLDLYETSEALVVEAVLPGVDEEHLDLSVTGSTLTIRAQTVPASGVEGREYELRERVSGEFLRSIALPADVEPEKAQAVLENGILHLTLPKAEKARPKKIEVKAVG
ncbi:MAG: Hsp20/alpha crystallin family protein [Anaerolineales bacterium]|nr:Hsp20/alpha crystallin family protein [Anaerolineales bacterium]